MGLEFSTYKIDIQCLQLRLFTENSTGLPIYILLVSSSSVFLSAAILKLFNVGKIMFSKSVFGTNKHILTRINKLPDDPVLFF